MNIQGTPQITAQQLSGDKWRLTVRYTATFTAQEVNQPFNYTFRDGLQIWEWDDVDHEQITGWVSASNFNPSTTSVQRTLVAEVDGEDLDTELGGEEIRAKVRLRNFTTGGVPIYKLSSIIQLAP